MMRKLIFVCLFFSFILAAFVLQQGVSAEETLTTYYPAPYGVYRQLASQTLGVGDNNDVPDPATSPGDVWIKGKVGIGTTTPQAKLAVNNTLRLTPQANDPATPSAEGTMYYNQAGRFRYSDGSAWKNIGSAELGQEQQKDIYLYHEPPAQRTPKTVECPDGHIATKIIIYTDNRCTDAENICDGKCHEAGEIHRIGLVCRKLE